jgi:hypothetical protein
VLFPAIFGQERSLTIYGFLDFRLSEMELDAEGSGFRISFYEVMKKAIAKVNYMCESVC